VAPIDRVDTGSSRKENWMRRSRAECAFVLALLLAANGCTALREVPRAEFGQVRERHGVRVETRDGLVYEFDYASFTADSLTGYRSRSEMDGPVDQMVALRLSLDDIERLTTRKVDWTRTGLIGGTVLAGVLVAGLNGGAKPAEPSSTSSGGGKGGIN
jgi:hypothetical protein